MYMYTNNKNSDTNNEEKWDINCVKTHEGIRETYWWWIGALISWNLWITVFYGFRKPDFPLLCEDSPTLVPSPGEAEATTVDGGVCLEPQSYLTPENITMDSPMVSSKNKLSIKVVLNLRPTKRTSPQNAEPSIKAVRNRSNISRLYIETSTVQKWLEPQT